MVGDQQPHMYNKNVKKARRRKFLVSSAAVGSLALAGCMGDNRDDNGEDRIDMLTTPSGTVGHTMGNGMMTTLTQNTDVTGSAQAGSGSQQNIVQVMRGEADLTTGVSTVVVDAYNQDPPFDEADTDYQPLQLMSFYRQVMGFASKVDDDYEYVSDLSGDPMSVGPQETSFEPIVENYMDIIMDDYTPAYHATDEVASALAADDASASIMLYTGGAVPSWCQEVAAENDLRLLGWSEDSRDAITDDPDLNSFEQSNEDWEDHYEDFVMEPETYQMSVNYVAVSSPATSEDDVYLVMETMYDTLEELTDVHVAFDPWTDDEFWTELVDTRIPFHPGAVEFLEDQGLWQDEFEVGEME